MPSTEHPPIPEKTTYVTQASLTSEASKQVKPMNMLKIHQITT